VAVVDGISPALSAAVIVMPYFFAPQISMQSAFYSMPRLCEAWRFYSPGSIPGQDQR